MARLIIQSYVDKLDISICGYDNHDNDIETYEDKIAYLVSHNIRITRCVFVVHDKKHFDFSILVSFPSIKILELKIHDSTCDPELIHLENLPNLIALCLDGHISSLNGIEYCYNLKYLSLENLMITDLSLLAHLNLSYLKIKNVPIKTLVCINKSELIKLIIPITETILDDLISMLPFPKLTEIILIDTTTLPEKHLNSIFNNIKGFYCEEQTICARIILHGYAAKLQEFKMSIAGPDILLGSIPAIKPYVSYGIFRYFILTDRLLEYAMNCK
jgi:hypothetical protein